MTTAKVSRRSYTDQHDLDTARHRHYQAVAEGFVSLLAIYRQTPFVGLNGKSLRELMSVSGMEDIRNATAELAERISADRGFVGPARELFFEELMRVEELLARPIPGM